MDKFQANSEQKTFVTTLNYSGAEVVGNFEIVCIRIISQNKKCQ